MIKRKKLLLLISFTVSVNAFLLAGCGAKTDETKETAVVSSIEETSSEEESTTQSPGIETAAEETSTASNTESATVEEDDSLNLEILDQMNELNEKGEFLEAIKATEGMNKDGDSAPKIIALRNEIIRGNEDYFKSQLTAAFENRDFYMIEVLSNFFELTEEQKQEYDFVKKLQGEYVPDDAQDSGVSVIITGYEIQINDTVDMFSFKTYSSIEGSAYLSKRLVLDNGGEVEDVNPGLISINQDNGTSKKYISAAGQEHQKKIEEKMKAEEESKAQAEREYLTNEPRVGMTSEEVLKSNWGKPNDINKTTYSWGVKEQWVYPGNKYIYIEDGIVTAISE